MFNAFNEEKKDKLIEYVMTKDKENHTALHYASKKGHEGIAQLLLNVLKNEDQLFEYVMEKKCKK